MWEHFYFCPKDGRPFGSYERQCPLCRTPRDVVRFVETIQETESRRPRKAKWRKLLYVRQDYPDNYHDHTFLEEMQKNVNVKAYDYWTVVYASGVVTQHISSIVIFVCLFFHVYMLSLPLLHMVFVSTTLTLGGYVFWDANIRWSTPMYHYSRGKMIKGSMLFFFILLALSPILKTLTKDTSDDTIWAMTVIFFLLNLLFHDYGSENAPTIKFPGSLSINAAIFASVLLASRLASDMHVFGLILFAVEWFALFPILRRSIKSTTFKGTVGLTASLLLVSFALLWTVSRPLWIMYVAMNLFITFICPFWLIWIQRYKNEIHGPWDEARITTRQ